MYLASLPARLSGQVVWPEVVPEGIRCEHVRVRAVRGVSLPKWSLHTTHT